MQNNENEVVYLYLDDIIPNRFQPRQVFDEKALKELAVSIKEHGVIQPIIVRNIGNKYEIIAGERRYKASALAGLTKIPAIVRNLDDKESSKVALLENLQRKNLNPIEEARTYQKILELDQMTQEELAKTMGKSQSAIANKLRLLSLTDDVQNALLKEQISERHARALLSITDPDKQKEMLKEVIAKKMTVRELEEKLKPKEVISDAEIDNLLQVDSVSDEKQKFVPVDSTTEFNQNVGIDYSTPPKFIDYGENIFKTVDEHLTSSADTSINLDEMKAGTKDIHLNSSSTTSLDSLLSNPSDDGNISSSEGGSFKFFRPIEDDKKQDNIKDQNVIPTPGIRSDSFSSQVQTIDSSTPTSMDSLLAGVEKTTPYVEPSVSSEMEEENNNIPFLDTYNNPFARNPIFSDDVQKLEGIKQQEVLSVPKHNFNDSIGLIRDCVKEIESSGFKVDIEEMNFEKNYQIVIKIAKNQEK